MARENNYLLGNGERLAATVKIRTGGRTKNPPYDFDSAKKRIAHQLASTWTAIESLPAAACPNGEAVGVLTMHPRYISKSDFPRDLLAATGLRSIGSRSSTIRPESWGIKKPPPEAVTERIFVAARRSAFESWSHSLSSWMPKSRGADDLLHIESISTFDAASKLRSLPESGHRAWLEVVLHNGGDQRIVDSFVDYARQHHAEPLLNRQRDVGGLTFFPVLVDPTHAETLAEFAFLRVARGMPSLRPLRPPLLRSDLDFDVELPSAHAVSTDFRAVVFDGGIPHGARAALAPWVNVIEPAGLGPPAPGCEEHGLGVTTSFLFESLHPEVAVPSPICPVDHVRVLDNATSPGPELLYYDVLDRIVAHLDANPDRYEFANISLGPSLPVEDDEVTRWTAALDMRFSGASGIVTVAAGNDGGRDGASGLNRVQPPADAVNVLSVGAADVSSAEWGRAAYSCVGPGRSPGLVKPDGVVFGGSDLESFGVLSPRLRGTGVKGTSFAAPLALRSAAAVRAQLGERLLPLAVRALLIHRAESRGLPMAEVGWGRLETDPNRLITCEDDESLVVFQGLLPISEHLRAKVPMPSGGLQGRVTISATLVIAPEVDPEHASTYTRGGLEIRFRPHSGRFKPKPDGTTPPNAKTATFFSATNMYGAAEYTFREGGHKWEPCVRNTQSFNATSLSDACFDIYYNHREAGVATSDPTPIPYAFIISLRAPKVPDLYDRVVRTYQQVLVPIRPRLRIQLKS